MKKHRKSFKKEELVRKILEKMSVTDMASMIYPNVKKRKDALKYRLSAEECMLYWMEHGCKEKMIRLHTGSYMFTPYIEIEVEGEPLNKDVLRR